MGGAGRQAPGPFEVGYPARHEQLVLPGDRSMVRRWTTSAALAMIRGWLIERGGAE